MKNRNINSSSMILFFMILCFMILLWVAVALPARAQGPLPQPLVKDVKNLRFVAVFAGQVYLSVAEHEDEGKILLLKEGKTVPFATQLDDPRGIVAWKDWLFVVEERGILRVDRKGKVTVFAANDRFPLPPKRLMAVTVDEQGTLYATDTGNFEGEDAGIFRIPQQGKITLVSDEKRFGGLKCPWGIVLDGPEHLLVADRNTGTLSRLKIADGTGVKVADGLGDLGGLAWDRKGRLYLAAQASATVAEGRVYVMDHPRQKPVVLVKGLAAPTGLCLDPNGQRLLVADPLVGTLTALPVGK